MWDNGLMNLWETWFRTIPGKCANNYKQINKTPSRVKTSPLALTNLAGAFVVLLVGYGLSLLLVYLVSDMQICNVTVNAATIWICNWKKRKA